MFGPGGAAELLDVRPTTLASRIKALGITFEKKREKTYAARRRISDWADEPRCRVDRPRALGVSLPSSHERCAF